MRRAPVFPCAVCGRNLTWPRSHIARHCERAFFSEFARWVLLKSKRPSNYLRQNNANIQYDAQVLFGKADMFCVHRVITYIYIDDILDWFLLDQESGFMCPSTNKNVFTK